MLTWLKKILDKSSSQKVIQQPSFAKAKPMTLKEITVTGYEKVVQTELVPGVFALVAIHNTKLGPALGGCRYYNYPNFEAALTDVLRLSEGMTYKSAMAGLPLGGGKSVIIGDPKTTKTEELLLRFGDFIDAIGGKYITAKDVGTEVEDLDVMARRTPYVKGTSAKDSSGDPSPMTAYGVYQGLKATAAFVYGNDQLKGRKIMVQGLGHVGLGLAKHLSEEGAEIYACDINEETTKSVAKNYNINIVGLNDWLKLECEIFAPCAMGAILNHNTIPILAKNGVKIVAGGANNQLQDMVLDGDLIKEHGITFAPDYIINAGGIINVASEVLGENHEWSLKKTREIYPTTIQILERAKAENKATSVVALQMAREKVGLA